MRSTAAPDDTAGRFVEQLVESLPWWDNIWREHQAGYGNQSPQAFLRTVAVTTASRIAAGHIDEAGRAPDGLPVQATLDLLESALVTAHAENETDVERLVTDSVVAHLPSPEVLGTDIAAALGPVLRAELTRRRGGGSASGAAISLIPRLAVGNPAMAGVLERHVADWDELLPTSYLSDLVRACVDWLASGDPVLRESVTPVLADLEAAYGTDYEADELIATGFVENLPYPDEDGAEMLTMLGPKLRAEYNIERPGHRI